MAPSDWPTIQRWWVSEAIQDVTGIQGIEFWETKKDKDPERIPLTDINMYTIGKDTYKILQDYQPFANEDEYIGLVRAVQFEQGKIDVYAITNPAYAEQYKKYYGGGDVGGVLASAIFRSVSKTEPIILILEDKSGHMRALPSEEEELTEALKEFFPERYVTRYEQEKDAIKYGSVRAMVKLYNSK